MSANKENSDALHGFETQWKKKEMSTKQKPFENLRVGMSKIFSNQSKSISLYDPKVRLPSKVCPRVGM